MQTIPLIFRCDASSTLGWGHFRRCFTLAEVAQQSGRFKVYFVSRPLPRALQKKLQEIHVQVQVLKEEATLEDDLKAFHGLFDLMNRKNIVVCVDHYSWTSECFSELKKDERVVLMSFDDFNSRHYDCDFVINNNLEAEKRPPEAPDSAQLLLGTKYTMIRDEIQTLRQHPTERMAEMFQFLVTLGGGDRWGHAIKILEAVKKVDMKFETHLVVGSDWPHVDTAKRLIGNNPRIHLYQDPSFFPQLMARSDLALTAAGTTPYELSYLGVPQLTMALVPQQHEFGLAWQRTGVSDYMGPADQLTIQHLIDRIHYWMENAQELEDRGVKGQSLVDGKGKFRVLEKVMRSIQEG